MKFKLNLCRTSVSFVLLLSFGSHPNQEAAFEVTSSPLMATCNADLSSAGCQTVEVCRTAPINLRPSQDGRILLGRLTFEPYVVAIPGRDRIQLQQVRRCIPDALILPSRRGQYIHVASFSSRPLAEKLSQHLREKGLDARVTYFQP